MRGEAISGSEKSRIEHLLRTTDMTLREIAERFHVSSSCVFRLNREAHIRDYHGKRVTWTLVTP